MFALVATASAAACQDSDAVRFFEVANKFDACPANFINMATIDQWKPANVQANGMVCGCAMTLMQQAAACWPHQLPGLCDDEVLEVVTTLAGCNVADVTGEATVFETIQGDISICMGQMTAAMQN